MKFLTYSLIPALAFFINLQAAPSKEDSADPSKVDTDYAIQGEYTGTVMGEDGDKKLGCQVVALGDGQFTSRGFVGGLPGDGWNLNKEEMVKGSKAADGSVTFTNDKHKGIIQYGVMLVETLAGKKIGELKRVVRKSPTLGAKPPKGAVVLFDGKKHGADLWKGGRQTEDGLLMQGCTSKQTFSDFKIHIEFRTPYKPKARGQGRGNSGFYAHGRYEVQVLDSFALEGRHNECGGIYSTKAPLLNMCYPPLTWQTYDVDFTAAKFKDGKKTANAIMTVYHNGVLIHDKTVCDHATTASPMREGPEPGPVFFQNHGNPVRYRNVWVEKK
ncbi:MAG: hypothetical protein CMI26_13395 [Opitutae bacterium]|nr:hypothetical protein [Opitutae bacterium]